jgi:D-sedoheptulose 7-phosphate isomerase
MAGFIDKFMADVRTIAAQVNAEDVEKVAGIISKVREEGGRLFLLGVGGSAANASHAVNDFRKLAAIEAYCPTDNVSELTARINDEGWEGVFAAWLAASKLRSEDGLLVLSVGGGDLERNVSPNLVKAIDYAVSRGAKVVGVVGRNGGYTKTKAHACVVIPVVDNELITPYTEAFQSVVLHLLVSHPLIKRSATKWETVQTLNKDANRL